MGLGGALFEQIDFDSGRIRNPHFAQYRLPRFSDMPQIEAEAAPARSYLFASGTAVITGDARI
jgi:CO/xanthine dehydrogenase Mo-binding subunit